METEHEQITEPEDEHMYCEHEHTFEGVCENCYTRVLPMQAPSELEMS